MEIDVIDLNDIPIPGIAHPNSKTPTPILDEDRLFFTVSAYHAYGASLFTHQTESGPSDHAVCLRGDIVRDDLISLYLARWKNAVDRQMDESPERLQLEIKLAGGTQGGTALERTPFDSRHHARARKPAGRFGLLARGTCYAENAPRNLSQFPVWFLVDGGLQGVATWVPESELHPHETESFSVWALHRLGIELVSIDACGIDAACLKRDENGEGQGAGAAKPKAGRSREIELDKLHELVTAYRKAEGAVCQGCLSFGCLSLAV